MTLINDYKKAIFIGNGGIYCTYFLPIIHTQIIIFLISLDYIKPYKIYNIVIFFALLAIQYFAVYLFARNERKNFTDDISFRNPEYKNDILSVMNHNFIHEPVILEEKHIKATNSIIWYYKLAFVCFIFSIISMAFVHYTFVIFISLFIFFAYHGRNYENKLFDSLESKSIQYLDEINLLIRPKTDDDYTID